MKRSHFIGIDVHCQFCEVAVVNSGGTVVHRDGCETTIPTLLQVIEQVRRPRALVIEEGPLDCIRQSSVWSSANRVGID